MASAPLRAGTAKVDITPPRSIPYLGYVPRQAYFDGVHDPLHARALVVEDGARQIAVVTADAIGFSDRILGPGRSFLAEFHEAVTDSTGIPPEAVMLAASHAHSTPETLDITPLYEVDGAVAWAEGLCTQLADAVAQAQANSQRAQMKSGAGEAHGIAVNRRQVLADGRFWQPAHGPAPCPVVRPGALDEAVGMVLFEFEDGTCSLLANFACHAVSVQVQPLVSADYPGVACSLVEEVIPRVRHCLFTQGACGNINPAGGGGNKSFGDVSRYGHILGGEIIKVVEQLRAETVADMAPAIGAAQELLALPVRELPDPVPYRRTAEAARSALATAATDEERFERGNQVRAAEESLRTIEMGSEPLETVVQAMRLGHVALVGCPGELFAELGLEIKQQSVAAHTLVVGYANDYAGYLSTPTAFEEGGYETSLGPWCRVGPAGGRLVVDAALRLTRQLWMD